MSFRVPKIHSCCCCSLGTASKIIGFIHMLFVIAGFAIGLLVGPHHLHLMIYESPILDLLIFTSVMLYGSFKSNHHLIFPWILLQTAFLVFVAFSCFSHAAYLGMMDYSSAEMPVEFILMVLQSWSILVVYNFYRELKEQQPA